MVFARHYGEMVLAMVAGMVVLGGPVELALGLADSGAFELGGVALELAFMGAVMTAPMIWWMRRRGHAWRPTAEMAASMVVPTVSWAFCTS